MILQAMRKRFLGGFLILLPLFVTVWILFLLFRLIDSTITPWVSKILIWSNVPFLNSGIMHYLAPVIGLFLTGGTILLIGILAADVFGRRLLRTLDAFFLRVPVIKGVYGSARQLMDAFTVGGSAAFRQVILVEYPRKGIYAIGFATGTAIQAISGLDDQDLVTVFLPTTPNPTSGMMIVISRKQVKPLPLTIEEGLKLIVSGGIVVPSR